MIPIQRHMQPDSIISFVYPSFRCPEAFSNTITLHHPHTVSMHSFTRSDYRGKVVQGPALKSKFNAGMGRAISVQGLDGKKNQGFANKVALGDALYHSRMRVVGISALIQCCTSDIHAPLIVVPS